MSTRDQHAGFRRVVRSMRLLAEHRAEVERVANEIASRGLIDLADDLRLSLKKLPATSGNQVR